MNTNLKPEALINNELNQVFLMSCRCGFPISFARHHWFVINRKGVLSRWEVLIQKDYSKKSWGYLNLDSRTPFESLGFLSVRGDSLWDSTLLGYGEGGEGSSTEKMIEFIESSPRTYPYCDTYLLPGPNSNTYIQWILDRFPEFKAKLPWNGFGKGKKLNFESAQAGVIKSKN